MRKTHELPFSVSSEFKRLERDNYPRTVVASAPTNWTLVLIAAILFGAVIGATLKAFI